MGFFNTHLPHNHGQARSKNTHARIARSLLKKRAELGAGNMPTVIVGDMNHLHHREPRKAALKATSLMLVGISPTRHKDTRAVIAAWTKSSIHYTGPHQMEQTVVRAAAITLRLLSMSL